MTVYQTSRIKRRRATKTEVEARRRALFHIIASMKPMTVRQVFYQATVRNLVEKTEAGYAKVQTDLVIMRRSGVLPYGWLADNTRCNGSSAPSPASRRRWRAPRGCIARRSGARPSATSRYGWRRTRWPAS